MNEQDIQWDDTSLPECGLCHRNCLCPYIVEEGLYLDGKPVVIQICTSCKDWLVAL